MTIYFHRVVRRGMIAGEQGYNDMRGRIRDAGVSPVVRGVNRAGLHKDI